MRIHTSLLPLMTSSVLVVMDNLVRRLVQSEEIFQTTPECAQFSQGHQKKHVTLTWECPWKSCSTTRIPSLSSNSKILKAFLKTFPTKMKPTKCKRKKMRQEKQRKRRGEKVKSKSQDSVLPRYLRLGRPPSLVH